MRFMNRLGLDTLAKSTHCSKTARRSGGKTHHFVKFVLKECNMFEFSLGNTGNMDETPMYFDLSGNMTIDRVGNKTITVKTTGHKKQHFSCACLSS